MRPFSVLEPPRTALTGDFAVQDDLEAKDTMVNLLQQQLKQMIEQGQAKDETIGALTLKSDSLYQDLKESREAMIRVVREKLNLKPTLIGW